MPGPMWKCPKCEALNIRVEGVPVWWEFDENGPVSFSYDDDLPEKGNDAECLGCEYVGAATEFKVE